MATKNFVPRAAHEGTLGTAAKPWLAVACDRMEHVVAAGEIIQGGRAVFLDGAGSAFKADSGTPAEVKSIFGISLQAALLGASVSIVVSGAVTDPAWSWVAGPIYCGTDGALTQIVPTSGAARRVAIAFNATTLEVSLGETIVLT